MSNQLLFHVVFSVVLHLGLGTVNFALHKSAVQSTTLFYDGFNWTSERAVDGNFTTCSATIPDQPDQPKNHTWEVDMGLQIVLKTITVSGRTDVTDQLEGFKLYIGNVSRPCIYNQELPRHTSNETQYVFKPNDVVASVISLMRSKQILTICEVTVEGECLDGMFSEFCNKTCGKCFAYLPCNKENGMCPLGCDQGWKGTFCSEGCERGNYGYNCNETCGNCLYGNSSCSTSDGNCTHGCIAGWQGYHCNRGCDTGKYGYNCNETCGNCFYGNKSCSTSDGNCNNGCKAGWQAYDCKKGCDRGKYGYNCNETCGNCLYGNNSCSTSDGSCTNGCKPGWQDDDCTKGCDAGQYGYNCNETCGNCFNGNNSCSRSDGRCTNGCKAGWQGDNCRIGTLGTGIPVDVDVGPNAGVIVGSVLAAVVVSIFAMVIIIVIVKKRRKRDSNETSTENVTTAAHYANLVVANPDPACKINVHSKTEKETTFSATEEASLQRGIPIGTTDCHSGIKEPDVPLYNNYEKLRDVTESTESAYSTIDHSLIDEQKMDTTENCSNYLETLQSLESALTIVEQKISVLLDRKEKLLCKELERARANKLQDKRKKMDSTKSDTGKDYTNVNENRKDDLELCGNFVQMLQSLEGELRILEEKRKFLLERKEILLRQELAKTTESEK